MIVTERDIQAMADTIVSEFRPQKIILFGSRAYGTPHEDSDVDLLVILPFEGPAYKTAATIRLVLPTSIPIDVIARTPEEFERRLLRGDTFISSVVGNGRVLFAA